MAADRMKQVALGAAVLAVAIVGMTALVVIARVAPPDPPSPELAHAPVAAPRPALTERHVAATDVVKLRTARAEPTSAGIRILDRSGGAALGLEPDDVIVAFSGRPLRREFDLVDALLTVGMMSPTSLYVEIVRGQDRALLVWRIDGVLRAARAAAPDPLRQPNATMVPDPLVATIVSIDDTHVEVPGRTADRIVADTPTYVKTVRALPGLKFGVKSGVKLYAIQPGSVIDALGFQNADVVHAVDGTEVTSLDDLADQLVKTRRTNLWTIDLERWRKPMILTITIK